MSAMGDSEEEDYMSDAVLAKCGDTKPCLLPEKVAMQNAKKKKQEEINKLNRLQNKSRKVLEEESRVEGLSNAISSQNKGFRLLQKMGYIPGTAIGKLGTGRIEPVPVELKADRTGLGQASERKRRQEEVERMRAEMAGKRARHEARWKEDVRTKYLEKEAEKDLRSSQLVCQQLDEEQGYNAPVRWCFWIPNQPDKNCSDDAADDDDDDDHHHHQHNDTKKQCEDEDSDGEVDDNGADVENEDDELSTMEKLELLTEYLRTKYLYCVWCGTKFEDEEDMKTNCPGNTADDHS